MNISDEGISLIKRWEGLKLKAYLCPANVPTIGYGTIRNVKLGDEITEQLAETFLLEDLEPIEDCLNDGEIVEVALSQNKYDALCSFCYNLGIGAFKGSTLLKKLNKGDTQAAADEFPKWNKVKGKPVDGLSRRRNSEREMFLKG